MKVITVLCITLLKLQSMSFVKEIIQLLTIKHSSYTRISNKYTNVTVFVLDTKQRSLQFTALENNNF